MNDECGMFLIHRSSFTILHLKKDNYDEQNHRS